MKHLKRLLIFTIILNIGIYIQTIAQISDLGTFMAAGPEDAEKMLEAYVSPMLNAFGASLTGGWYNTAKAHKPGGFDITISATYASIPNEFKSFNVDELELTTLVRADGTDPESPTIAGKGEPGPQMNYNHPYYNGEAFEMPQGVGLIGVPTPMIQAGIGIYKETEIMGRLFPKIKIKDDNDIFMWGVGLKHSISQWIPGLKELPVLNISLMGGYTRITSNLGISVNPSHIGLSDYNTLPDETWNGQNMFVQSASFTGNLLVSADLPIITFYGGVGIAQTKTTLKMQGVYPMLGVSGTDPIVETTDPDPISMEVKNQDGGIVKPRFNIGMRLKFGVFTLHGDYTRANFNAFTAGVGVSFR
ncbi:MAG: hypothetical protein JW894_01515 [Bacteroidales bacterium]|nr:hypothetical protein [Bacteroidales bacterium]